jgi:hypothetical protein
MVKITLYNAQFVMMLLSQVWIYYGLVCDGKGLRQFQLYSLSLGLINSAESFQRHPIYYIDDGLGKLPNIYYNNYGKINSE